MKTDWQIKKLGSLIKMNYGKGLDKFQRKLDGNFPIYGANGELGRTDKFLVEGESIIIGRKGSAGEVTRISGKFWPSDVTYYVFGNNQINIDYLFYFFKSIDLTQFARGVKPGINRNDVYNLNIPLPPLETQKEIVSKLDEKFAKLKEAKNLREKALADTEKILSQTLREIFEGGKGKGWKEDNLMNVCLMISRGISPKYTEDDGVIILNQKCIRDHLVSYSQSRIHNPSKKYSKDKLIQVGDVLVNSTGVGTLGRVAQVKQLERPTLVDSHITIVRPNKNILGLNYFGWMMVFVENIIKEMGTGSSGQTELSRIALGKIEISYPLSVIEQEKIVEKLDALSEKIKSLRELQTSQLADLKLLEKAYLKEAFNGELI